MIDRKRLAHTALTLTIAAAGGGALALLSLPAAWLTGAMIAVAAAAMAGVRVDYPATLRNVVFVMLGSALGTGVSPGLLGHLGEWPLSMAILVVAVAVVQLCCQLFLTRICGWDRQTSFFAAIPGMANYVILLALPTGADITRIALSQTVRVFLLVGMTPSLVTAVEGAVSAARVTGSPADIALTLVAGTAGGVLFRYVGVPAAPMIGAMTASGVLHGAGLASGYFPPAAQAGLFVALGAMIGSRFAGTTLAMLRDTIMASVGSFVVAVGLSALAAWLAAAVTGQTFGQLALAFAPGGMDVMTTMAFALSLDSAFVAAHQLARFFVIALYAPVFARRSAPARAIDGTERRSP